MSARVNLYDTSYHNFAARAQAEVRAETYGEDLGQSSWMTADELRQFIGKLKLWSGSQVLEVGCGAGGASLFIARTVRCPVLGIDINDHGIRAANETARRQQLDYLARFEQQDASKPLSFAPESFDAILCNDVMCHIPNRQDVFKDWFRLLRPGGRMLFTDGMVISMILSDEEIAIRSSIGRYFFLPPGENERLIREAGFRALRASDFTAGAEAVAHRWHEARARRSKDLIRIEGKQNFDGLQKFLACVHLLYAQRRLLRCCYVGVKPAAV